MGRPEEEEGYAGPSGPRSLALCMDGGCFGHRCLGCRSFCVSETWGDETHGRGLLALLCCNVTPQRATCGATVCAALRVSSFAIMQVPLVRFVFGIPQDCFVVRFFVFPRHCQIPQRWFASLLFFIASAWAFIYEYSRSVSSISKESFLV